MAISISTKKEIQTYTDENGNQQTTIKETTKKTERSGEPDYIKLYTNMWCEFNQIPIVWRALFLELISAMTYCNSTDLKHSQIVYTGKPFSDSIMERLEIGQRQYQKGLKALVDSGAIRKVARGVYQINPAYAGRGEWKYNPRFLRGGVEDLKATFDFKEGTVDVNIIWADNGEENSVNEIYRNGLNTKSTENTVLKTTTKKKKR